MSNEGIGPIVTTPEDEAPRATCPVLDHAHAATGSMANQHWWPDQLNLRPLGKNSPLIDPMGERLRLRDGIREHSTSAALKADVVNVMTTSQDWWPADYGHYGPLFIRMAWHSAGTYRIHDGRGGAGIGYAAVRTAQQLARQRQPRQGPPPALAGQAEVRPKDLLGRPVHSCRQLCPRVHGLEDLRLRRWSGRRLGARRGHLLGPRDDLARRRALQRRPATRRPLRRGADGSHLREPEGPNGNPDPVAAARDIRETFARMAMDDEETVALIAGGHTFGKTHGAADADRYVGREPEAAPLEEQGLGWRNTFGTGVGGDSITSGIEIIWTIAHEMGQRLLRQPVRVRVGVDAEPGGRQPVAADRPGCGRQGPRCP